MKYYIIAGEASGDLHASRLMSSLKQRDAQAEFRFIGGDQMLAVGGTMVRHYRELAYMGFVPVLMHLPAILRNMRQAKRDISQWQPDAVILVDYPGFNLSIAKYAKIQQRLNIRPDASKPPTPQVYYYISPKIWAWKEYRIKNIKRDIDQLFSILPFEKDFFEGKHHYPIHYVGNPTADEVRQFINHHSPPTTHTRSSHPTIAILCGSRRQEIRDNLPLMLRVAERYADDYNIVIAGAPAIEPRYYQRFTDGHRAQVLPAGNTYPLLLTAHAALVTSGTATLETALFGVPQVVCYKTPLPHIIGYLRKKVLKVRYISLVNLIADREVVPELVADTFTETMVDNRLKTILDGQARQDMMRGYQEVWQRLGTDSAPDNAAQIITSLLHKQHR